MTSKKLRDNIGSGLWCEYGNGYTTNVFYEEANVGYDEAFYISYHKGDMPAFNSECFRTIEELEGTMRNVQRDMRKWRLCD